MGDVDQQAILEAARDAQVQLMVWNDVSKLPLWFGVSAKNTITARQWLEHVERSIINLCILLVQFLYWRNKYN